MREYEANYRKPALQYARERELRVREYEANYRKPALQYARERELREVQRADEGGIALQYAREQFHGLLSGPKTIYV